MPLPDSVRGVERIYAISTAHPSMSSDDADSLAKQVDTRPDGRWYMRLPRIISD